MRLMSRLPHSCKGIVRVYVRRLSLSHLRVDEPQNATVHPMAMLM
jgi:hypothetical protein